MVVPVICLFVLLLYDIAVRAPFAQVVLCYRQCVSSSLQLDLPQDGFCCKITVHLYRVYTLRFLFVVFFKDDIRIFLKQYNLFVYEHFNLLIHL